VSYLVTVSKISVLRTAGGVIGGLAAVAIFALAGFYFIRRKTATVVSKERPVDLLQGDPDDHDPEPAEGHYYHPEPFLATEPTDASSGYAREDVRSATVMSGSRYGTSDRRQSAVTSFSDIRSATPDYEMGMVGSTTVPSSSRKSAMPRQLRPVNIIQHDDAGVAGEPEPAEGEPETVELPPAYTNIRKTD
jgi:hypothetical protein